MIWFREKKVKVVFSHDYYHGFTGEIPQNTIDIMKFKRIRDRLVKERVLRRKKILIPEMISYEDMALVHDKDYLNKLKDPVNVGKFLKIGHLNPWDSHILEYFRIVTGGTLLATDTALKDNITVFNLGGGFHHAHANHAGGLCLVNDVAIAIEKINRSKEKYKVMIIDLDYHQGDGNLVIFKDDPNVFTFSIHANHWSTIKSIQNLDISLKDGTDGNTYLEILESRLTSVFKDFYPDLVFFVAGSDPYEKDVIGDMTLSREQMLKRNLFVLNLVRASKIPLVIVAGGGYGTDSWKIYYDFIKAAIKKL